jgi:hypothetical protein
MAEATEAPANAVGPTSHTQNQAPKLTAPQLRLLLKPVNPNRVRDLKGMSYMEVWDIRRQLIRTFGFAGYAIETLSLDLIHERSELRRKKNKKGEEYGDPYTAWTVIYRAQVRLTVFDDQGRELSHWDDAAGGDSVNQPSLGDAHDMAMKTSVSQALKRCATNLGDQFGLSLYNDGSTEPVVQFSAAHPPSEWQAPAATAEPEPNDPPVGQEPRPEAEPDDSVPVTETADDQAKRELEELKEKVRNGWKSLLATEQNLLEAEKKGLADTVVPFGEELLRLGDLLKTRIKELEAAKGGSTERSAA